MLISCIIFSMIAILAGKISDIIKRNKKIGSYLKWIQVFIFILIAIFILI